MIIVVFSLAIFAIGNSQYCSSQYHPSLIHSLQEIHSEQIGYYHGAITAQSKLDAMLMELKLCLLAVFETTRTHPFVLGGNKRLS